MTPGRGHREEGRRGEAPRASLADRSHPVIQPRVRLVRLLQRADEAAVPQRPRDALGVAGDRVRIVHGHAHLGPAEQAGEPVNVLVIALLNAQECEVVKIEPMEVLTRPNIAN